MLFEKKSPSACGKLSDGNQSKRLEKACENSHGAKTAVREMRGTRGTIRKSDTMRNLRTSNDHMDTCISFSE